MTEILMRVLTMKNIIILRTITAIILLGLWRIAAGLYGLERFPGPWQTVLAIVEISRDGSLAVHIAVSMFRFSMAYIIAAAAAIPIGLFLGTERIALKVADPLIQLLRPISPVAWFPLAVLWFGIGNFPAIFIIFMSAFFPILLATICGVREIPQTYLKAASNFGVSKWMKFEKVIVPAAFPSITTGLRIAVGTAWIHLVAGEMLGAQSGLGFLIVDSRNFLRTDMVVAAMFMIGVLGLVINLVFEIFEKRIKILWGMI